MFVELMPLLAGRTVMITVARADDRTLRVNVIPTKKNNEDKNAALTTPLSYTGTPEELDRELGQQLAGYVDAHQRLGSTLAQAKAEWTQPPRPRRRKRSARLRSRARRHLITGLDGVTKSAFLGVFGSLGTLGSLGSLGILGIFLLRSF